MGQKLYVRVATQVMYRGCSSDGKVLDQHARGMGIDTPHFYKNLFLLVQTLHVSKKSKFG